MSVQKERKLKKLKKQRMWPYVLGIFMVIAVFSILTLLVLCLRFVGVIYDKAQQGYDNSKRIVQLIEKEEIDLDNLIEIGESVETVLPYVKGICIADSSDEILFQYGEDTPDWENYIPNLSPEKEKFVLVSDESSLFHIDDNEIIFQIDNVFRTLDEKIMATNDGVISESLFTGNTLTELSFWYVESIPNKDYQICVKNTLPINMSEIVFMTAIINVIIIMALLLVIYYLVSIFSLFIERRKLAKILDTDMVTGGYNLQYFYKKGEKLLKKNRGNKYSYSVVAIRMEKYSGFCACYGVKEGEELLEEFYLLLQQKLSKKEVVARGANAEFALLLSYQTEMERMQRIGEILSGMEGVKAEQKKYFSVGVYNVQEKERSIEAMYNCAGIARSKVHEDSEKRIVFFNEDMNQEQIWRRTVENDMESALLNKEFQVYLQPKYSTKEEVLSGAEALVRWIHPKEGFVAPYRFIPIFESNGFVIQLDDYMLTEVARQQAKWLAEEKQVVPISVNVSRVHFLREDLAEHICKIVDEFQVPHHLIELELTESAFFDDKNVLLGTIKKLKSYGFPISMDDFGAGYSSLNSLKELPLDVVKLDAEFFRREDEAGRGRLIVGDTISLAKKLQMKIVAEGIETREQVDFLTELDCDLIQGYYFAKPMPIAEFEEKAFGEKS